MKTRATPRSASPRSSAGRASRIRLLVLDVDGVLTDGILVYGASGEEIKRFHVRDGLAMQAARRAALPELAREVVAVYPVERLLGLRAAAAA